MKYEGDVPENEQITMNEFSEKCALPGDRATRKDKQSGEFQYGIVREVGSANPEYVLNGPGAADAGMTSWKEKDREECRKFLASPHRTFPLKLEKSMWVVIEFMLGANKTKRQKIYTYDILRLKKEGGLVIIKKENPERMS